MDHATSTRLLNAAWSGTSPDTVRDRNYSALLAGALLASIYRPAAVAWRP
ncbi:hypothetical protein AB0O64_36060 [Streptomyces sp. NPDC088341]